MQTLKLGTITGLIAIIGACQNEPDAAISTRIEANFVAKHSDVDLYKFARFYVHNNYGSVSALYIFKNSSDRYWTENNRSFPIQPGKVYWVERSELPNVMDGGCTVINVSYNTITDALVSVECNSDS